jgi:hypothetical protein
VYHFDAVLPVVITAGPEREHGRESFETLGTPEGATGTITAIVGPVGGGPLSRINIIQQFSSLGPDEQYTTTITTGFNLLLSKNQSFTVDVGVTLLTGTATTTFFSGVFDGNLVHLV